MKTRFNKNWKRSKQPRKQRKYRANAPSHLKGKFLSAHLSKDLREKYGKRSLRLRKGDRVEVMRGEFKGESGKVQQVDVSRAKVYLEGLETTRRDGSKAHPPLKPSNLKIIELNKDDAKRMEKLGETVSKKKEKEPEGKKEESESKGGKE